LMEGVQQHLPEPNSDDGMIVNEKNLELDDWLIGRLNRLRL
jgi:hypothetical protein